MFIVNLVPVAAGGGLQNALSFLDQLKLQSDLKYIILVRKGSYLEGYCQVNSLKYKSYPSSILGRLYFEFFGFYKDFFSSNYKLVFTLFGNCPVMMPSRMVRISGFARSNIIETDVDFWNARNGITRTIKKVNDLLILSLVRKSDIIIVETDRLLKLALKNRTFPNSEIKVIRMSPSSLIIDRLKECNKVNVEELKVVNILYISGPHYNKNIHKLGLLFYKLNNLDTYNFNLVVTLNESKYLDLIRKDFEKFGVEKYLKVIGSVQQGDVPSVISDAHALINVAELESFSNNWVEAWASNRLLIARNAGYARDSCKNAAFYIDIEPSDEDISKLQNIFKNDKAYSKFNQNGFDLLKELPTADEKFQNYMAIINEYL